MKRVIKYTVSKLAVSLWILISKYSLFKEPTRGDFNDLALKNLMGRLYQNPAMQQYLDLREEMLIHNGMKMFMEGKLKDTDWYAGQVYEIRRLRTIQRECYARGTKGRDEKIKKILNDRKRGQTRT